MPDGIDREKLIDEARQHLSAETDLADDVARINTALLVCHLREQDEHYRTKILPLYPTNEMQANNADSYEDFDVARNEFLESLWGVIGQHFTDERDRNV